MGRSGVAVSEGTTASDEGAVPPLGDVSLWLGDGSGVGRSDLGCSRSGLGVSSGSEVSVTPELARIRLASVKSSFSMPSVATSM